MNISPNFSPPIALMRPYFTLSGVFYVLSMFGLFFLDPFTPLDSFTLIGWVHLYMLGFVMMAICAAMAQLSPIVIETEHYSIKIFNYLWYFLVAGLALMLVGFYIDISYLLYGGTLVLISMLIYATEFILTLKNAKRKTSITKAMWMSNFFLLLGIVTGLVMAAAFNGYIDISPEDILNIHTFGLLVGFIILLIMGISIILIPMFGSSSRISDNEFTYSFYTVAFGVIVMMLSPFFFTRVLEYLSYTIVTVAILLYFYQLYKMTSSRKRVNHDIWAKHMYVAFSSFLVAFILLLSFIFTDNPLTLKLAMFLMFIGFFGFVIIGNFYKIIPFLVWFHIYSPLIEERAVPMLHELVPKRLAALQWFYSLLGFLISSLGLLLSNRELFISGTVLLSVAGILFFIIINKILNAKA